VPDAVVCGIGTGGTLLGVGRAFRAVNPACAVVGVEPAESRTLSCGEVGRHRVEGIADGFVPGIVERHRDEIDELVAVPSEAALDEMRRLARAGLLVGPSSGAHVVAAGGWLARHPGMTVVTFCSDAGEKYLTDHFAAPQVSAAT
jgi:cysteine synthase